MEVSTAESVGGSMRPPRSIVGDFVANAIEDGDRPAVRTLDRSASYTELASLAGGLARSLTDVDDRRAPVVLVAGDGVDLAAGAIGIIGAGRGVVSLSADLPPDEIRSLAARAGAHVAVSSDGLGSFGMPTIDLGSVTPAPLDPVPCREDDLALVSFTSGSTGEPKLIRRRHANILSDRRREREPSFPRELAVTPADRVGLVFATSGVVALPVLRVLAEGGSLAAFDIGRTTMAGFAVAVREHRVTYLRLVPSILRRLCESAPAGMRFEDLRTLWCGGEPLLWSDVDAARRLLTDQAVVLNQYGSTELGAIATKVVRPDHPIGFGQVPAGHSLPGYQVWIDDGSGRPAPPDTAGEIVVDGDLAANFFSGSPDDGMSFEVLAENRARFRTGDRGRIDRNGVIEHLGRLDRVVKIGGTRIQPATIEDALRRVDGVRDAAVVARPDAAGENRLEAHVVVDATASLTTADLRSALRRWVQPAAVPARFSLTTAPLPLLPGGKVDHAALPGIELDSADRVVVEPADELEVRVAGCVSEVLGVGRVGVTEDFFDLGGDSLRAQRLCGVLARRRVADLPASVVFEHPTVRGLAGAIRSGVASGWSSVVPLRVEGSRPPLVCFHASSGEAVLYAPLAELLGPDQPVYAVQADTLTGRRPRLRSVEQMADAYSREILERVPAGPCALFGQSFGGLVAFEVAKRLRSAGREVPLVVLGDTTVPGRAASLHSRRLTLRYILFGDEAFDHGWRRRIRFAVTHRLKVAVVVASWAARRPVPVRIRQWYIGWCIQRASLAYRPRPDSGRVVLLRSTSPDPDPLRGWGDLVDEVTVHHLDGAHHAVVAGSLLPRTAEIIRAEIDVIDPAHETKAATH